MVTSTAVLTLTDFLLARIAEDEVVARAATPGPWHADDDYRTVTAEPFKSAREAYDRDEHEVDCWVIPESSDSGVDGHNLAHIARHDSARVLADCAAKRKIIDELRSAILAERTQERVFRYLASAYASHSDFDDEWRS